MEYHICDSLRRGINKEYERHPNPVNPGVWLDHRWEHKKREFYHQKIIKYWKLNIIVIHLSPPSFYICSIPSHSLATSFYLNCLQIFQWHKNTQTVEKYRFFKPKSWLLFSFHSYSPFIWRETYYFQLVYLFGYLFIYWVSLSIQYPIHAHHSDPCWVPRVQSVDREDYRGSQDAK